MRKFDSAGRAETWLDGVMQESVNDHENIRIGYHDTDMVPYIRKVEYSKKTYPYRVDLDVIIGKRDATIGCDVIDMDYQFEGRKRV